MIPGNNHNNDNTQLDFTAAQLPGVQLHQFLANCRRSEPLQEIQFPGQAGLIITGFEALKQAFRDGDVFPPEPIYQMSTEPVMGRTFISMEQAEHNIYRKLTTPAFRSQAVAGQQDTLYADIANQLIDRFIDRGTTDLVDSFTRPFSLLVISYMLGLTVTREADFRRWSQDLLSYLHHPESALNAASELGELLQKLIDQRRANPRDDVVSELALSAPRDARFCDTEIPANSLVLFGIVAANRDPAVFDQPDVFNPLRDSSNKLTFGPGARTCPGMHLARKELLVALQVLLKRLPGLQLRNLDAAYPRGSVLRGPQALHVSW